MTEPTLFDLDPAALADRPAGADPVSAGRRLTARQADQIAHGIHPLTGGRLHPQAAPGEPRDAPGRRCGNCAHRRVGEYPKCFYGFDGRRAPRATRGPATDCRAWWPACPQHQPVSDG